MGKVDTYMNKGVSFCAHLSFSEVSPPFLNKCLVIEILFAHIADENFVKSIFIVDKHAPKDLSKSRVLTCN